MNYSNRTNLSNDDGGNEFFHIQKHSGIYHTFMNESVWNMNNIQEMKWGWNCNWIDAWMVSTRISYGCEKKLSKIPSFRQLLKAFSFSIFIPSFFATECSMSWMFQGKKMSDLWMERKNSFHIHNELDLKTLDTSHKNSIFQWKFFKVW